MLKMKIYFGKSWKRSEGNENCKPIMSSLKTFYIINGEKVTWNGESAKYVQISGIIISP